MSTRVGLAVNPTAGKGRGATEGNAVAAAFGAAGLDVVRLVGRDATDLAGRVDAALAPARDGLDALVVVGGDGMVHLGTNAVAGTAVPLGIVAAGTGNDVARGLGLPVHDAAAAARVVLDALTAGTFRPVDAARVAAADGMPARWFAGVLGVGFDAVVNERANRLRWPRGRRRYDVAIALELPVFRPGRTS